MNTETQERIIKKVEKIIPELSFRVVETPSKKIQLIATVASLTLSGSKMELLGKILGEFNTSATLGRSGAKFRMIIS